MPSTAPAYWQKLPEFWVTIKSVLNRFCKKGSGTHEEILPVVIVTQETVEENIQNALHEIEALETVIGSIVRIRIESLA